MSERRERIDRAIDELVVACLETADTPDDEPGAVARILAEQRLRAALDAEPTEAEIDRLAEASWYAVDGDISSVAWSAVRHALKGEKERRRVRAIIAARKAGRE